MLQELVDMLGRVTRLLIIGCRGTDEHFLSLLENRLMGLNTNVPVHVVAGNKGFADQVAGTLQNRALQQLLQQGAALFVGQTRTASQKKNGPRLETATQTFASFDRQSSTPTNAPPPVDSGSSTSGKPGKGESVGRTRLREGS